MTRIRKHVLYRVVYPKRRWFRKTPPPTIEQFVVNELAGCLSSKAPFGLDSLWTIAQGEPPSHRCKYGVGMCESLSALICRASRRGLMLYVTHDDAEMSFL